MFIEICLSVCIKTYMFSFHDSVNRLLLTLLSTSHSKHMFIWICLYKYKETYTLFGMYIQFKNKWLFGYVL